LAAFDELEDPRARPLRRADLASDPLSQFEAWYREVQAASIEFPHAVALATATRDGKPSVRMVLMKDFDERGFTFHTNYVSRKGIELAANRRAALLFYWHPLGRQVRIEGRVERLSEGESDAYFATRPLGGRFAAMASRQSEPIASREALEDRVRTLEDQYANAEPERPGYWGGFLVVPDTYEFWQHRENRLHDRFRYTPEAGAWKVERLQP
jgi:pyridoxamine 5'-phosphate oxidase